MKNAEVKLGGVYYANVSGKKARVRIDAEASGGGWTATNLETNKLVRIKTARRLLEVARVARSASAAKRNAQAADRAAIEPADGSDSEKRLSALSAAAKVLSESVEPLSVKQMVEAMSAKGYWSSPGGKTPHATLYSAILREITGKGEQARFVKTDRGRFAAAGREGGDR